MIHDSRRRAGGPMGGSGRPGGVGPPSSRPQLEELRSGERVTEPGRPLPPMVTGPARRARFVNRADLTRVLVSSAG
jgi:hypothetical protein